MLYIKTIERGHMPNKQWEVIRLDKSYAKVKMNHKKSMNLRE